MNKDILEGKKDPIGRTMKAVNIMIAIFELIGLIILGSIFYSVFF